MAAKQTSKPGKAAPASSGAKRGRPPGSKSTPKKQEEKKKPMKLVTKTSKTTNTPAKEDKKASVRASGATAKPKAAPAKPELKTREEAPAKIKTTYGAVFLKQQKARLLQLKDDMVDSMTGVAQDTLRSASQDGGGSAFGMHQADAGSDAYDRDFALNLLSQEQDALYEIEEALKRIDALTYGVCEMSGKPIPQARLEVRPYARFTVECQEIADKDHTRGGGRFGVRSLFGLGEDDEDEDDDNDSLENEKD